MEIELLEDYKRCFGYCQDSLRLAREIVNGEFIEKTQPPLIVKEIKEKWFRFFSAKPFYKTCHHCSRRCCSKINLFLDSIELLYIVANNPDFEFPEPDWEFLVKEGVKRVKRNRLFACLFLSEKGCLLRENKSRVCLFYVCFDLRKTVKKSGLKIYDFDLFWEDDRRKIFQELNLWLSRICDFFSKDWTYETNILFNPIISNPEALKNLLKRR